jgi:hypothetical protein
MQLRDTAIADYITELDRLCLALPDGVGFAFTSHDDTLLHVQALRSLSPPATWEDVNEAVRKAFARKGGKGKRLKP